MKLSLRSTFRMTIFSILLSDLVQEATKVLLSIISPRSTGGFAPKATLNVI